MHDLKKRQARLNGKHLSQTQLILDRLRVRDEIFWQMNAAYVLGMLHKFAARDLAQFLDIFDREILDQMGEPLALQKCDDLFFERIVGILPMFVPQMNRGQIVRSLEVITKKELGSQRLFDNYLLMMVEKQILSYSVNQYIRVVQTMADRNFIEDFVFWDRFAFRYIFDDPNALGGRRSFEPEEARAIWDAYVYVRIRCPSLDIG